MQNIQTKWLNGLQCHKHITQKSSLAKAKLKQKWLELSNTSISGSSQSWREGCEIFIVMGFDFGKPYVIFSLKIGPDFLQIDLGISFKKQLDDFWHFLPTVYRQLVALSFLIYFSSLVEIVKVSKFS